MEIVVHGTKQGYKSSFIPNVTPSFSLGDIRKGANSERPLGKSAYSIAFVNGSGYVYSKYTIVRDTLRSYATGTIAFSLYLSADKELQGKGKDVKLLLDGLSSRYSEKYIKENNINRGEAGLIHEDWSFVNEISDRYTEQKKEGIKWERKSGEKDAAIIYYENDDELQEYFDKPFQKEYGDYKQVLFVENSLKGSDKNPLTVMRNSGEELTIDLKNDYYYLERYVQESVRVMVDDNEFREGYIRAKQKIKISYTKEFYETLIIEGTLFATNSDIHKYVKLQNNQITVKYEALGNLTPQCKSIAFAIKEEKENPVQEANIQIGTQPSKKVEGYQYEYTFKGSDIGGEFSVTAKKGNAEFSSSFTPKNISTTFDLILRNHQIEKSLPQTGNETPIVKLVVNDQSHRLKKTASGEFKSEDDQGKQTFTINIQQNEVHIIYSENGNHSMPEVKDKGKKKTFFLTREMIISMASIVLIVLGFCIWGAIPSPKFGSPAQRNIESATIQTYVNGNSLFLNTLKEFKDNWAKQKPTNSRVFWNKISRRLFKNKDTVVTDKTEWEKNMNLIDNAIVIRELIDKLDFYQLSQLSNEQYSDNQRAFKQAVDKIKNGEGDYGSEVAKLLYLTLSEIADSINRTPIYDNISNKATVDSLGRDSFIQDFLQNDANLNFDIVKAFYGISDLPKVINNALVLVNNGFWKEVHGTNADFKKIKEGVEKDSILIKNTEFCGILDSLCNIENYQEIKDIEKIKSLQVLKKKMKDIKEVDTQSRTTN